MNRRTSLRRTSSLDRASRPLTRRKALNRGEGLKSTRGKPLPGTAVRRPPISAATPAQRAKAKRQGCIVCGPAYSRERCGPIDPAHVIDRSLLRAGQDEELAIVGLCRVHHERYDRRAQPWLDLLPYLGGRPELDFAVDRHGHDRTLWRVTNRRPR